MKFGIDARIFKTGIGRYTQNLLNELVTQMDEDDTCYVFLRAGDYDDYTVPDARFTKILADYAPYSFAEQILFLWQLWRMNLDLVHFTNFNLPVLYFKKYVVTIHDLIHQSHSTYGSSTRNYLYYVIKKIVYFVVIRWVAWRSERIIVPSKSTQQDVEQYLKVTSEKIEVTYEGFDPQLENNASANVVEDTFNKYGIKKPYLLYVATMYPHKNHEKLIEAFRLLQENDSSLQQLVLVGKVDYFSRKLQERYGDDDSIVFANFACDDGYVPDQDLQVLYQEATAYAFPSLKEGFGIPILEAQAYGIPVLAADIFCLREIGEDSVIYFDPHNPRDIATKIQNVLNDEKLQQQLRELGGENIIRFNWSEMARKTYILYKEVVN